MNKYIAKVVREIEYKVEVEAIDADNARIKACEDYETKGELISDWVHPVFVEEKESEPKEPRYLHILKGGLGNQIILSDKKVIICDDGFNSVWQYLGKIKLEEEN